MAKPTMDRLYTLFDAVADTLAEAVLVHEVQDEKGNPRRVMPTPAFVTAAIAFLKNNDVTADPATNDSLAQLREAMAQRQAKRVQNPTGGAPDPLVEQEINRLYEQWNAGDGVPMQ